MTVVSVREGSVASAAGSSDLSVWRSIRAERAWAVRRRRESYRLSKARARARARDARTGSLDVVVQPGALAHFPQIDQPYYWSAQ